MIKTSKTTRMPQVLADAAERRAAAFGISFSDFVIDVLADELNLPREPAVACVIEAGSYLQSRYTPDSFPLDVTREVFRFFQTDLKARNAYNAAIAREDGTYRRRATAHPTPTPARGTRARARAPRHQARCTGGQPPGVRPRSA